MFALFRNLIFALLVAVPALAQTAPPQDQPRPLDGVRATIAQIENALKRVDLADAALVELRGRLEPLTLEVQAALDDRGPRLDAIKARLEQLGPKPAASAPPEGAEVTRAREEQQKQFDDVDASIKRARLLAVQIDQIGDQITARRRELFTRALFTRTHSILSPELWFAAGRALPGEARAAATVTSDWLAGLAGKLRGGKLAGFLALTALIGLGFFLATRAESRVVFRDPAVTDPGDFRKALTATWIAAVTVAIPILAVMAFLALMRAFELSNPRMDPLVNALADMVTRVAIVLGLTRGVLAPAMRQWRLLDWADSDIDRLCRLAFWIVVVHSLFKVFESLGEIIIATLPVSIALRAVGAMIVALVLAAGLRGFALPAPEEDCLGPIVAPRRDWTVSLRAAAWVVAIAIALAALAGYIAFASFLVDQLVWIAYVGVLLFLLSRLAQSAIAAGLRPQAKVGRAVMVNVGLRPELLEFIAIVLSGFVTLALIVAAAMLALAPWGVESNDMLANVRAAFFGFKVGDVTVSLSSIIIAIVVFALGWAVARALQRWLNGSLLPHTQLDTGLRNSIATSIGYIGFVIALSLALSQLGLSFDKLAIVAGALSVGIGFGLQSIVSNFVSGLILLWERAIRVGDWVVLGDEQGYVRRINVRSTEIETFDRATMIVPNANLVSGVVKNWVRNDRVGRIKNSVSVNIGTDPEKVRAALIACALAHDGVLKDPEPYVNFTSLTDGNLKFDLVSYVADVERSARLRSDLNFAIFKAFADAGLDLMVTPIAPPLAMSGIDRAEAVFARNGGKG